MARKKMGFQHLDQVEHPIKGCFGPCVEQAERERKGEEMKGRVVTDKPP